jgi:hypothetical protein
MIKKKHQPKQTKKQIPFLWKNLRFLKEDIAVFWKPITGVVAIYGLVYAFVVIGFNFIIPIFTSSTNTGVLANEQNQDSVTKLLTNISDSIGFVAGDEASTALQFVLFVLGFLALVSILRRTRKLDKARISDSYFEGTGQFVSMVIIFIILLIFLVPISIGSTVLLAGISFASTAIESSGVWVTFLLLALLSIWLYSKYWPAIYIASLPSIRPFFALKQAGKLTKGHRLNIFFQFFGYFLLSFALMVMLFAPIGLLLPVIAPYWLFILALGFFATSTLFGFIVYRSLIDD